MDDKIKEQIDDKKENSTKNEDLKPEDNQKEVIKKEDNEKKSDKQTSETKLKEIITTTDQKNEEPNDEFNNAIELIRAHLKCIEKLQHVIVKNLFNEKTTTNSSMSIKLECLDDQNYLTMETNFLTRTKIPNFF